MQSERLSELFCCMTAHGIEPKRLRLVCHREGSAPNLVLVEGRRGGRPGLRIEPTLILHCPDGRMLQKFCSEHHSPRKTPQSVIYKAFTRCSFKGERTFYFIILFSFSMHSGHTYLPPKETMCLTLPQNTQAS